MKSGTAVSNKHAPLTSIPVQKTNKREDGSTGHFDFAELERQASQKKLKYTKKLWRVRMSQNGDKNVPSFTRKKFEFKLGELVPRYNSSTSWIDSAERTANMFWAEIGGGHKLQAACKYLEKGKFYNTKEGDGHLKVLVTAQKKFEAKVELKKADSELEAVFVSWRQARQRLDADMEEDVAVVKKRMAGMDDVRTSGLRAMKTPAVQNNENHKAAQAAAQHLQHAAMESAPAAPSVQAAPIPKAVKPKKTRGNSKTTEKKTTRQAKRDPRLVRQDGRSTLRSDTQAAATYKSAEASSTVGSALRKYVVDPSMKLLAKGEKETEKSKSKSKKPVTKSTLQKAVVRSESRKPKFEKVSASQTPPVLNREALREFIRSSSEKSDMEPRKLIEYFLLDLPVAAYIPEEMYNELRQLYVELNNSALKEFAAAAEIELKPLTDEVVRRTELRDEKLERYNALPVAG